MRLRDAGQFLDQLADGLLGRRPDDLTLDLTAFEKKKSGNASDVVTAGDRRLSSTLSLPTLARPAYASAMLSTAGAITRQGAHQVAQKSTRTGLL